MKRLLLLILLFTATLCMAQEPLAPIQTIPLEGVEGRIDHMSLDADQGRLYVTALGNNTVEVIDLNAGKCIETITGPKEPQGIVVVPDTHALVVASGADGMCRVYDKALKPLGALRGLDDADNVRYDAANKCVWVGYGSGALAAIDPAGPAKTLEITLDGHPESFQLESDGNRIFVNVPSAGEIVVLDKSSGKVLAHWPVKEAKANFPMALDEKNHRLFVGCREPAKLLVFDTETGKVIATTGCCGDTDDIFYDAPRKRLYVSGGEGCITVLQQSDADHYLLLSRIPTAAGARTSYFAPATDRLYVAVPHRGQQAAELRVYQPQP